MNQENHSSLYTNCHHQITYQKFNLIVFYPPSYEREVWHYKLANSDCIQRAIANFDWEKAFRNVDLNKQIMLFNEIVPNIIRNFTHQETVTIDDRDLPEITSHIKRMINDRILTFKCFVNKKGFVNSSNLDRFSSLQN